MILHPAGRVVVFSIVAIIGATLLLPGPNSSAGPLPAPSADAPSSANDACALLTPADIAKAAGLKVGAGTAGKPMPGILGKCTWTGEGNTGVIVTLTDAQHMQITMSAVEHGGKAVPDIGSKAVGIKQAAFVGGYIVWVLDANGGFGASVFGKNGTLEQAIAVAKMVESRR